MLELKNITKTYITGDIKTAALDNVSLSFGSNEFVAILGASGSGKSLLAHGILHLLPYNAVMEGNLLYRGEPLTPKRAEELRGNEIVLVPQGVTYLDPLMKVGVLTLNENPENFFAQIEQAAFAPSNIVPGIEFSADKMLQGRTFAYRDTQRYRVGTNFAQLPVNRPVVPVHNDMADGAMNYTVPKSNIDYKPNSLADNRPCESGALNFTGMYYAGHAVRSPIEKTDDFSQATARYASLPEDEKARMAEAMAHDLSMANAQIQERSLKLLNHISSDLCQRVSEHLSGSPKPQQPKSQSAQRCTCGVRESQTPGRPMEGSMGAYGRGCRGMMMTRERYLREHKDR